MTALLAGLWTLWATLGALWFYFAYRLVRGVQVGDDWAAANTGGVLAIVLILWVALTAVMWPLIG